MLTSSPAWAISRVMKRDGEARSSGCASGLLRHTHTHDVCLRFGAENCNRALPAAPALVADRSREFRPLQFSMAFVLGVEALRGSKEERKAGEPSSRRARLRVNSMPAFLASMAILAASLVGAFGQTARVDAFKNFLASPPPIARIVFKKRDLYQYKFPGAPQVNTNAYRYFDATWQNTDFVLREAESLDQLEAPRTNAFFVYGKNGSTFWKIVGDNYVYWVDKNSKYSAEYVPVQSLPPDEDILVSVSIVRNALLQAINMGIGQLKLGTLNWHGDSFAAEDQSGQPVAGELIVENGVPVEIRYHRGKNSSNPMVLEYTYSTTGSPLPDKFHDEYTDKIGIRTAFSEFEIISLQVASSIIPGEAFSAKAFQVEGVTKTIQQAGQNLYWKDPNGAIVPIKSKNVRNGAGVPRLFVVAILFVSILFALVFLAKNFGKQH